MKHNYNDPESQLPNDLKIGCTSQDQQDGSKID